MPKKIKHSLTILFLTLISYAIPLINWTRTLVFDWRYFFSLHLVAKSLILNYKVFPLHNPWICGGIDILSNPQNRIFSPSLILDLIFDIHKANLLSLILFGFIGGLGMFRLLKHLKINNLFSYSGVFLFLNCSWFSLHFAEGHIIYGTFQLLPWLYLAIITIDQKKSILIFFGLLSLFLLDGGIYTFIFSLILTILTIPFILPKIIYAFKKHISYLLSCILAFILLITPKIIPVLQFNLTRTPWLDNFAVPFSIFFKIFFYPLQYSDILLRMNTKYYFHEFGCYVGILSVLIVILTIIFKKGFLKNNLKYLFPLTIILWASLGYFPHYNPWNLLQQIPLINHAHIQSRLLIIFFILFLIILLKAFHKMKYGHAIFLLIFILLESFFVRTYIFKVGYDRYSAPTTPTPLIKSKTITRTIPFAYKPIHYITGDMGTFTSYEPSYCKTKVRSYNLKDYFGEINFRFIGGYDITRPTILDSIRSRPRFKTYKIPQNELQKFNKKLYLIPKIEISSEKKNPNNFVEYSTYTPGYIALKFKSDRPREILMNTNALKGWKITKGQASLETNSLGLLHIKTKNKSGNIVLQYKPDYLYNILIAYLLGIILFIWLFFRQYRKSP